MLETAYSFQNQHTAHPPTKVLQMVKNDRMGGFVPKWDVPATPKQQIASALSHAAQPHDPASHTGSESLLAYNPGQNAPGTSEEFKFGDLVDMVNPLHHIPLVGHVYRELTGDEIKPIGQIMGGALYGGGLGAAGGLVNVIIEEETGKDITENAIAMAVGPAPDNSNDSTVNTVLSFGDLRADHMAEAVRPNIDRDIMPPREPITQVHFEGQNGLYAL